jgi:hypothetical protein
MTVVVRKTLMVNAFKVQAMGMEHLMEFSIYPGLDQIQRIINT